MGHSDRALVPIFMSSRPHYEVVSCPTPNVPTYEFRCPSGHDFERFFKTISTAPSQVECPECGAVAGRQLSSGAGLVFKGSGFYLTDYGKNAHRKAAPETKSDSGGDSSTSKADTAGKSESKAESKPKDTSKAENPSPKPSAKPKKE